MAKILIVDDEPHIREQIYDFMLRLGHEAQSCENAEKAIEAIAINHADIALLDVRMPGMSGIELINHILEASPQTKIIMISGNSNMDQAIEAMRFGAEDFLRKPVDFTQLEATINRCLQLKQNEEKKSKGLGNDDQQAAIIGESKTAQKMRTTIELVATYPSQSLLLEGETGTGKEVAARYFHSLRCPDKPFIAFNCPALPDTLVESILFGHVKGAFTGAESDRSGAFESAEGGILFLDEIGDLNLTVQAKLLRALESRQIARIGSTQTVDINTTVIAASNRPLTSLVKEGLFRQDLFFRLNGFTVELSPLRERRDDILPLAHTFLERFAQLAEIVAPAISPCAEEALLHYSYPGNIRELKNVIERACIMAAGNDISAEQLVFAYDIDYATTNSSTVTSYPNDEAAHTHRALCDHNWNRRKTAAELDISYDALRWRIKKYALIK